MVVGGVLSMDGFGGVLGDIEPGGCLGQVAMSSVSCRFEL